MPLISNEPAFKKFLKGIGVTAYKEAGNSIVLSSSSKSRAARKSELQATQAYFNKAKIKSTLIDDGRSGYLEVTINSKKIKIFSKPEKTAAGIILKPSFFSGLTDVDIKMSEYGDKLLDAIKSNSVLDSHQKELLLALAQYHITFSPTDLAKFKKTFKAYGETLPINTINNDFGEVLGPLAVVKKKLLPLSMSTTKVFIPGRSNEPLLDYKLIATKGSDITVYKISAKSGDTTNTLKPGDVIKLIDEEHKILSKHKNSDEYKVLKLLAENSWKEGPIKALAHLKSKNLHEAKWLKDATYTEQTRQQAENSLMEISKKSMDFTKLYKDATHAKIYYVKFKLEPAGTLDWELLKDDPNRPEAHKRIEFRSKNYVGRPNGDKLGFQPK